MSGLKRIIGKAASKVDIPADIAAGLPRIEITGFMECSLDCHTGILEYEKEKVVVALNIGTATIEGNGLEVYYMHQNRLTIRGEIRSVRLEGSGQ